MSSGIWYNNFKFTDSHPEQLYNKTLALAAPVLHNLVRSGIVVVWIALPPRGDGTSSGKYGWDSFEDKDRNAEYHFRNTGVLMVNGNEMIKHRYSLDNNIFKENGVHYCEPGKSAVPTFINTLIMQRIASALANGQVPYYSRAIEYADNPAVRQLAIGY